MDQFSCPWCSTNNRTNATVCLVCSNPLWVKMRYQLEAVVEYTDSRYVFSVLDHKRCGADNCGALLNDTSDTLCPICGADPSPGLRRKLYWQSIPPVPEQARPEVYGGWFYEEAHNAWIGLSAPQWRVDWFPNGQRIETAVATHAGQVYGHNEDALLTHIAAYYINNEANQVGVLAVADGIGGHASGEIASKAAITGLLAASTPLLVHGIQQPDTASADESEQEALLKQAVFQANQAVFVQHQATQSDMGAALTAVWLLKGLAIVANVGDSRTYLYRAGQLQQITHDHSLVYHLYQKKQITREEIYTHPERNKIYRSLGDEESIEVDTFTVALQSGDVLVLCCDGLWEMVRDEGIAQVLAAEPNLQTACDHLVAQANEAGGEDNISIILAQVQAL